MSSAVATLQSAISGGAVPLTRLLRQAKVIAGSLNLPDVQQWVDLELKGYNSKAKLPPYRWVMSAHADIRNPVRGWLYLGPYQRKFPVNQPAHEIERLSTGDDCYLTPQENIPVVDEIGSSTGQDWPQRILVPASEFARVSEAIKDQLLDWTIELAKRGIKGQDSDFTESERANATIEGFMITKTLTGKRIFIGHGRSPLWRELKDFLKHKLNLDHEEFNREPTAGIATKERLEEMLESSGFAFIVMTAEDEQADGQLRARENVVHEAGLFQGRLGFRKAIILREEKCPEFSNIHGLTQIPFPNGKILAASEDIRDVLKREGIIP